MRRYIMTRILFALPTMIGVLIVAFLVIRMIPGDPALMYLGESATEEQIVAFQEAKGLNQPLIVQMGIMLKDFAQGDLGDSFTQNRSVMAIIIEKFPNTFELAVAGIIFASFFGILFGVIAALKRGKWADIGIVGISTIFMSMPSFLWALILMMIFGVKLGWIPVISIGGGAGFRGLIAPALSLGIGGAALFARTTRSSMLEVLGEDFIRTARAKGMTEKIVIFKHALKAAGMPIITIIGFYFASYLAGAIVIETIFARPGIGKMLIDAVYARDYAVVQGTTVFIAGIMVAANLITDIIYGFLDPRVRIQGKG
ncbi:MAG: ABC transporter permease [Bacillota bacterium]|jgi:ABC-type dipeptide/oligopeptide/nickel transport system permease component